MSEIQIYTPYFRNDPMFGMVLAIYEKFRDTADYFFAMTVYCSAIQLCFVSILITKIKWFWSSFFDFLYHIFFIFLIYSTAQLAARSAIFITHFICFLSFLMIVYDQERSV